LPNVDPAAVDNYAFRYAAENGHLDVVKFLSLDKRAKPAACNNYAIRRAASNGHLEVIKYLMTLPNVQPPTTIMLFAMQPVMDIYWL
jgi:hypothetical protein